MSFGLLSSIFTRQPAALRHKHSWPKARGEVVRTLNRIEGLSVEEQRLVVHHCDAIYHAWAAINPGTPLHLDWFETTLLDKQAFRAVGREMQSRNVPPVGAIDPKQYFSNGGSLVSGREDLLPVFRQCVIAVGASG